MIALRRTFRPNTWLARSLSSACDGPWSQGKGVNCQYQPDDSEPAKLTKIRDNTQNLNISSDHALPIGSWSEERLRESAAVRQPTCTWLIDALTCCAVACSEALRCNLEFERWCC